MSEQIISIPEKELIQFFLDFHKNFGLQILNEEVIAQNYPTMLSTFKEARKIYQEEHK